MLPSSKTKRFERYILEISYILHYFIVSLVAEAWLWLSRLQNVTFDIQQVEWETILSPYCDNTTDMATIFQEIFGSILDIHAPLRRKRVRSDFAPWLNPSPNRSILERHKLKVQAENSPEIWSAYKRKRNQVKKWYAYLLGIVTMS